ncbi:MAG: 3-hydroxyacyl-CoA dehydrogenase NAD-binding domain-containing protein [Candidatus Hodarchaeales archaeon]
MNVEEINHVAVIGAGTMGHGIAEAALIAGYTVSLYDITEKIVEKGKSMIDWSLKKFVEKRRISESDYYKFMKNLTTTIDLKNAVKNADLIIEAVPEILDLKKKLFKNLDELSPKHAILASNTSTMSITEISDVTQRPDKVVGMHFSTPVILSKGIEIVRGTNTSNETMDIVVNVTKSTNRIPFISKDSPGFICNRIAAASILLTQLMLENNEYPPEKIDAAAMNMGMKMGPYELLDYLGLDVVYHSSNYFAEHISKDYTPSPTLVKLISENKLGKKTEEGIYKWPESKRPKIDLSDPADFDLMDLMRVQINEAVKVYEEGIASAEDIDLGMKLNYNNPLGPFELVENVNMGDLTRFLDGVSEKYGKELFRAHKWIRDGSLLKRINRE